MKDKKYNHSFARRLTRWVMIVLLIMMGALSYLIYATLTSAFVEVCGNTSYSNMRLTGEIISNQMNEVGVAVKNNIFDIERNLGKPDEMQHIVERIVSQNPNIRSCGISFIANYYPNKGRAWCPYARRVDSLKIVNETNSIATNNYLEAEWFKEAVAKDSVYWSKPFFDSHYTNTALAAYMHPVHDKDGRLVAIIGADLSIEFMTNLLEKQDKESTENSLLFISQSFLLANDGTFITHPEKKRILRGNFFDHLRDADNPGLTQQVIKSMRDGEKSHYETDKIILMDRERSYLFYTSIKDTDWILTVSMPTISLDLMGIVVGIMALFIISVILMVTFFVIQLAIKHMSKPLKQLATTADGIACGQLDADLPSIESHDEIHMLRDSFENMQNSLARYIEELKATTAEKASIESELKIAHDIQMSMLPKTYPAFPDRSDVDIYGQLTPAKAVGGDLYDFFIRDDKLFFCIGDVSGKGVPASLVMAVTRSLFRNISAYTQETEQIAMALNDSLSNNNETNMFVTLFIGVLDLTSGHLSYSNAAHNPPLLLAGEQVSLLPCDANIPAGVIYSWEYTEQHIQLNGGDTIFLYTDGLNEAEDINRNQFGMDRVLQVGKTSINNPANLIKAMTTAVQLFVGEAEQSDDLTMLAIQYKQQ